MEFNLSENTTLVADTARRYLKDHYSFDVYRAQLALTDHCDASRWQSMAELGWFGLPFPEAAGGYDGSLVDLAMIVRELGASLCLDPFVDLIVAPGKLLELIGSERALAILQQIIIGERRIACAFYDIHSGYDIHNPSAILNGHRLSGQKAFVADGGAADTVLATVRRGEVLALVLLSLDACEISRYRALDGSRACSLILDDVVIDDDAVIACGDQLVSALDKVLCWLQALDCARIYGAASALYERTLEYAKTRKQFGVSIGSFQVIQHYLVDMFIDLQQLESMLLMVSVKADDDDERQRQHACSASKAYFADRAVRLAQQAIQIHGGVGMTEELDVGHFFRQITHRSLTHGNREYHLDRFASLTETNT